MNYQRNFGGAIWTNHALDRIGQRGLTQEIASAAFQHPDNSLPGRNEGSTEYQKRFGKSVVSVIAKKNDKGEWIILSCWVDIPLTQNSFTSKRKRTFLSELFFLLKKQLGF